MASKGLSTSYTTSYANYGKQLFESFEEEWTELILLHSPLNYRGLDMGACDGSFAEKMGKRATELGRGCGEITCIDPYPVEPLRVLCFRGEVYVSLCDSESYDFIICKFMIHFVAKENMDYLLEEMKRILRPGGRIYIMTLLPTTFFPWSHKIQADFVRSCFDTKSFEKRLEKGGCNNN
jgi:SAM-dependent methyltransferase